jgi:hypothetical protein
MQLQHGVLVPPTSTARVACDALARWHEPPRGGRGHEPHDTRVYGADPQSVLAERAVDFIIDLDLSCPRCREEEEEEQLHRRRRRRARAAPPRSQS